MAGGESSCGATLLAAGAPAKWRRSNHRRTTEEKVALARAQLVGGFNRRVNLARLARRVGLNGPELSRQFARFEGVTPLKYLVQLRMKEALRLLRDPEIKVATVAGQVGYLSRISFAKAFRSRFHMTPSAARRSGSKAVRYRTVLEPVGGTSAESMLQKRLHDFS